MVANISSVHKQPLSVFPVFLYVWLISVALTLTTDTVLESALRTPFP